HRGARPADGAQHQRRRAQDGRERGHDSLLATHSRVHGVVPADAGAVLQPGCGPAPGARQRGLLHAGAGDDPGRPGPGQDQGRRRAPGALAQGEGVAADAGADRGAAGGGCPAEGPARQRQRPLQREGSAMSLKASLRAVKKELASLRAEAPPEPESDLADLATPPLPMRLCELVMLSMRAWWATMTP